MQLILNKEFFGEESTQKITAQHGGGIEAVEFGAAEGAVEGVSARFREVVAEVMRTCGKSLKRISFSKF